MTPHLAAATAAGQPLHQALAHALKQEGATSPRSSPRGGITTSITSAQRAPLAGVPMTPEAEVAGVAAEAEVARLAAEVADLEAEAATAAMAAAAAAAAALGAEAASRCDSL